MGPRLQPVRQIRGHGLHSRGAPCPAEKQGACLSAAQQQPHSLGAVKSFVSRHCHEGRSPVRKRHREYPRGLGRIHDQRRIIPPAQLRNRLHRLHAPEHIGYMVAHHRIHAPAQGTVKSIQYLLRRKQRRVRHYHFHPRNAVQHPCHGVMLISADGHPSAGPHQASNGNVQPVGSIGGKDHLVRCRNLKQPRCRLPAGKGRLLRSPGGRGIPASRGRHSPHRPGHSSGYLRRLFQGCGSAIQIDHTLTSR